MTKLKRFPRFFAALLAFLLIVAPLARPIAAQQAAPAKPQTAVAPAQQNYAEALAAIETAIDARRKELGIPGASLVIVKDDRVIYMKGLGLKDIDRKLPVTPDTLFAIGSASKAFTAMAAVISADEGRLSLDDSPKKFLPYFTLRDTDAAAKITLRDLLSHRSGLNRTDLAMVTNQLNREELIRVAGLAKPTNKLGEKWQYQNVMYAAAGEVVARAQNSTWDRVMETKIFKPLGMKASDTTAAQMQKARDFSFGYDYNASTKVTRQLPQREIPAAAPAGAINSNARDMAQWLRFMLGGGVINGKRLVSEKGFNETITKQMNIAGTVDYGLGWFLRKWNDHKVVEHGGNIDGFNSQVALMPDQKLGFVLLTNVTGSSLGAFAMNTIWKNLVGERKPDATATGPTVDPKTSRPAVTAAAPATAAAISDVVGSYKSESAGPVIEIAVRDGKVSLVVPGQNPYPLVENEKDKLRSPGLPDAYWIEVKRDDKNMVSGIVLNQPEGRFTFSKVGAGGGNTLIASDELLTKMIAAYGGEANLRKHKTSVTTVEIDMEHQGVQGYGVIKAKAPNMAATETTLTALDKKIGLIRGYFDGNAGGELMTFAPDEVYSGKRLEDIKLGSDFYDVLDWKKNYPTITVKRIAKVGDEDAYVIEKRSEKGSPITDYVSVKSFLLLKRESVIHSDTTGVDIPQTETFSDYRNVDGVMVPFKSISSNIANGDVVMRVKELKFDVEIPDSAFTRPTKPTLN